MTEDMRKEVTEFHARAARGTDKCEIALASPFSETLTDEQFAVVAEMVSVVTAQLILYNVDATGLDTAVLKATIMGTYVLGYMSGKGFTLLSES